jgi:hypothetical protein
MIFSAIGSNQMDAVRKNRNRKRIAGQTTVLALLQGKNQLSHLIQ